MRTPVIVGAILLAALGLRLGYVAVTPDYGIVHERATTTRTRSRSRRGDGILQAADGQADRVPAAGLRYCSAASTACSASSRAGPQRSAWRAGSVRCSARSASR